MRIRPCGSPVHPGMANHFVSPAASERLVIEPGYRTGKLSAGCQMYPPKRRYSKVLEVNTCTAESSSFTRPQTKAVSSLVGESTWSPA
ncbi:MAG: hypothetical protein BWY59_00075 [Verrucomicrobia bacterium ADurb.Bin345]|nr:MAG: hypothetical protein BWY59_00075 [Verrucomicrobia bacterium ADurb.Bin345]